MVPTPSDSLFELWRSLAKFSASETDAALTHLQEWIEQEVDADNVIWIGGVRILHGKAAEADAFLGWRLRDRVALRPDPPSYRQQLSEYYEKEHYGKLTPTYYQRSHEAQKEDHIGMDSRASMVGSGRFRVHRVRDKDFLDFAAFQKTPHYERYYRGAGIVDRMMIAFPVTPDHESYFLIDRFEARPCRRLFTLAEARLAGAALRGLSQLHYRLLLGNGLLMADKLLSPMEREILRGLLTDQTEKQIAASMGRKIATVHTYVTNLYDRYGVTSRQGLMALWLKGN
jgi:DNA-binding CsgD family transcriptional regulator